MEGEYVVSWPMGASPCFDQSGLVHRHSEAPRDVRWGRPARVTIWQARNVTEPAPLLLDLADFDAVGIATDVVVAIRSHAIDHSVDTSAELSAPEGWHRVMVNCSATGQTLLRVVFADLTRSRANNVARALGDRDWQVDEDGGGASRRYPPGTEATTVAFDALAALAVGGAPTDIRTVRAHDREGRQVAL